jgi:hypothetical protein
MHRRHQLNYVPGVGYYELGSKRELKAVIKSLEQDVRGRLNDALQDPDGCLEAGAQLRFQLCCRLLKEIASGKAVTGDTTTVEDFSVLAKLGSAEE